MHASGSSSSLPTVNVVIPSLSNQVSRTPDCHVFTTCNGAKFTCAPANETQIKKNLMCEKNNLHVMEGKGIVTGALFKLAEASSCSIKGNYIMRTPDGIIADRTCMAGPAMGKNNGFYPDTKLNLLCGILNVKCNQDKEGKICGQEMPLSELPGHWHNGCQDFHASLPELVKKLGDIKLSVEEQGNQLQETNKEVAKNTTNMAKAFQSITGHAENTAVNAESIVKNARNIAKVAKQVDEIVKQYPEKMKKFNDFTVSYNALEGRVSLLEKSDKSKNAEQNRQPGSVSNARITFIDNQLGMHAVRLAEHDLRFQVLETANYEGVLLWKIKDFARRKRDADNGKTLSLYSKPFHTSRHGYKMCARIYLNGDGMGKGTHCSLFFVVMRGNYDALLPWPFRQKVTLMLLDQETGRRHLTDSFRPDPKSSSYQRPTTEMNIASGCPLFVNQQTYKDCAYVKDDIIFMKVIVDTSDLYGP